MSANWPGVNGQGLVCVCAHINKSVSVCYCLYVCVHVCVYVHACVRPPEQGGFYQG